MTFHDQMIGWEEYPLELPPSVRWMDDVYELQQQLEQKSKSLFVSEPSKIKLEVSFRGTEKTLDISSITSLKDFLMVGDAVEDSRTKFFMISRRNSYTKPKISSEIFKTLCHFYRVFPKYLHCVFQFREKHCEEEEYFSGGCYRHVHEDESKHSAIFEICYNVRYFEKHGRQLEDPWSSRQCSVYQNYSQRSNASTWILIHIPNGTRDHLERFNSETEGSSQSDHPMRIHMHLLLSCEKNWGPYIGYLGDELLLLNQKISFPKKFVDFNVDVSHSQSLAHLRRKLEDARSLLETNLENASTLSEHAEEMQNLRVVSPKSNGRFQSEIRQYQLRLRCHIRNITKHIGCSEDIRVLIFKIMDFRNDELHRLNSHSMEKIAHETAVENKIMVTLAHKAQADSRTMRIAALIGTIYASISLVTSFFSTPLIQYPTEPAGVANVKVRKEAWIYVVISLGLVVGTLLFACIWRQRRRRKPEQDCEKLSEE
ncbi:hypothetical protein BDD12DRAFT_847584 [Trichophaea hybrida]|nr:hypothetical protein BDD12DRAFT_847584 [Trichophaea hybrida]